MHLVFAIFLSLSNQSSSQGRALRRGPITGQLTGQPHTTMHQNSVSVPLDHPDLMDHLENQVSSGYHLSHATLEYRSQGPHPSLSLSSLLLPPLSSTPFLSPPIHSPLSLLSSFTAGPRGQGGPGRPGAPGIPGKPGQKGEYGDTGYPGAQWG